MDEMEFTCPVTGGEHYLEEVTSVPLGPSGVLELYLVCEACGAEIGPIGKDSVL